MGWNDHVEYLQTYCKDCGETDSWQYWDRVGRLRYADEMGQFLGVDVTKHGKCPNCGSTNGVICED